MCSVCILSCFSSVGLFATLWTVTTRFFCPWNAPDKNTGVGCYTLLQGIFPTQGLNPHLLCLLHWQAGSLPLVPPGKSSHTYIWIRSPSNPTYIQTGYHQKKKFTNNKCQRGCGETGTLLRCWYKCKLVQLLWRTVWRFLKKLKIKLPYDLEIPLLGYISEETHVPKDKHTPLLTAALFTIAKTWK